MNIHTYISRPNIHKSEIDEHYVADLGTLAWPCRISTRRRSNKLRMRGVQDISPTKRLASLWAPKLASNFINLQY